MEKERRIIDKRKKEKYMMDDEYLNGQAKLCGWQGTIVYTSLCRHANINQESFPSIKLMAEQHGVSRPTIMKGIENLEKNNVIEVKKTRTKDGKWLNNTYILLDKSEWDYSQVNQNDMDSQVNVDSTPSQRRLPDGVNVVDTKETHSEGNTYKETHPSEPKVSQDIVSFIDLWKDINPAYREFFKNKTERSAAESLLKISPLKDWAVLIPLVQKMNAEQYAKGKSTKPTELLRNIGHFKAWTDQKRKPDPKRKVAIIPNE